MYRYTHTIVRSGQPRPYADTERVSRLFVEWYSNDYPKGTWLPLGEGHSSLKTPEGWPRLDVEQYKPMCQIMSGWTYEGYQSEWDKHFFTYLDYIRQVGPGLIEWRTVTPFTD